jgi:hypothetical protein
VHRKLYRVGAADQGARFVEQQPSSLRHKNAASDTMRRCSGSVVIMETVRACTMPGAKLPPSLG